MPPVDRPALIAVDGRSGAGKTTLALELAALLRSHHTVAVFHLEDIYPGWHGLAAGRQRYREKVLEPLAQGRRAEWTAWNWNTNNDGERRVTEPAAIVILEGVGAADAAARGLLDAAVWIDADAGQRRTRAIARDGAGYEPYWDVWARQEEEWLAGDDVAAAADILVRDSPDALSPAAVLQALLNLPQLEPLLSLERSHPALPSLQVEKVEGCPDAADLFRDLYGSSSHAVWLDSSNAAAGQEPDRNAVSIMADGAGSFGQLAEHRAGMTTVTGGRVSVRIRAPFFRWLDSAWGAASVQVPEDFPSDFALGWLGCLGYELKRECGGNDVAAATPDAALIFAGRGVVLDHQRQCTYLLALSDAATAEEASEWLGRTQSVVKQLAARVQPADSGTPAEANCAAPAFSLRDSRDDYQDKVRRAKAEIREGNSYEICLTTQLAAEAAPHHDDFGTYLALRRRNPAPFATYLKFGDLVLSSTSPERFMSISPDGWLRAEPIKGTRRRVDDPAADAALKAELAGSKKDRAENIMIVDLLRNDLSHYAVPGTLQVSRLCAIESYATVHQMVSTIDALLRPEASRAEAVAAAFPAGSMTGAPKISTMDILDRLECGPRGLYSGAAGYFSLSGGADLSVVIRTLVRCGSGLSLGVGGAITADSEPEAEWDEVRAKAFGVLSALGAVFPEDRRPAGPEGH
ncbi:para-aminobenzoate synthase subunit I [Arthrobacter crystallopoietes BAB-32]|uniref:aminodeoxychorismate synthase n=1 Tax=Arthrobacter crystallopoietes BAB-32 TaxID=1246476 RepID=N1V5W0_9MICC|nr:aminodeoxychorismate synthase component I [Arthrobacter crystallopoietes]EMY33638.1 para-aminobenzoate synthase subunit I [Arthrobacter crystallopoietes BAB-32]